MDDRHDVVIVGAGPAGAAAGYFLARSGLRVLLLDKFSFPRDKTCGDGLPPRALPVLDEMGLLGEIQQAGWKSDTFQITAPAGRVLRVRIPPLPHAPSYSVILPRLALDALLVEHAIRAGAVFQGETHVTRLTAGPDGVTIMGRAGTRSVEIRARMAILAAGASTRLLKEMGILADQPPTSVAARAYFENIPALDPAFQFWFSDVRLPGYGWIFPISETSANIGVGYIVRRKGERVGQSPRAAFERFIRSPAMARLLDGARLAGAVKSYPLRSDFVRAPTFGPRLLLAGEAAGLVNPLTGDGIDYALESGRTAARHLAGMFAAGDFAEERLRAYDRALRQDYQDLFLFCERVRHLFVHPLPLNLVIALARRRPALAEGLARIVLGARHARAAP